MSGTEISADLISARTLFMNARDINCQNEFSRADMLSKIPQLLINADASWEDLDTQGLYTDKYMFHKYIELCERYKSPHISLIQICNIRAAEQGQTPLLLKFDEKSDSDKQKLSALREAQTLLPIVSFSSTRIKDPKGSALKILQNLGKIDAGWAALDPDGLYTDHGAYFEKFFFPCKGAGVDPQEVIAEYNLEAAIQGRKLLPLFGKAPSPDLTVGIRRAPSKERRARNSQPSVYIQ